MKKVQDGRNIHIHMSRKQNSYQNVNYLFYLWREIAKFLFVYDLGAETHIFYFYFLSSDKNPKCTSFHLIKIKIMTSFYILITSRHVKKLEGVQKCQILGPPPFLAMSSTRLCSVQGTYKVAK